MLDLVHPARSRAVDPHALRTTRFRLDASKTRRASVSWASCLTSLDTAHAMLRSQREGLSASPSTIRRRVATRESPVLSSHPAWSFPCHLSQAGSCVGAGIRAEAESWGASSKHSPSAQTLALTRLFPNGGLSGIPTRRLETLHEWDQVGRGRSTGRAECKHRVTADRCGFDRRSLPGRIPYPTRDSGAAYSLSLVDGLPPLVAYAKGAATRCPDAKISAKCSSSPAGYIGQACGFDYSALQACKALREAGCEVMLVAPSTTIMTDPGMADHTISSR